MALAVLNETTAAVGGEQATLAQALALEVAERMATGNGSAASSPLPRGL